MKSASLSFRPRVVLLENRNQPGSMLATSLSTSVLLDNFGLLAQTASVGQDQAQDSVGAILHDSTAVSLLNTVQTPTTDALDLAHSTLNLTDSHAQPIQNSPAESASATQLRALQNIRPSHLGVGIQGNLVVNGDFETDVSTGPCGTSTPTPEVPGWTTDDPQFTFVISSPPNPPEYVNSGNCAVVMGPTGQTRDLSQIIPTTAGASYNLDFFVANPTQTGATDSFAVLFDGNVVYTETQTTTFTYKEGGPITVTASGDSAALVFRSRQEPNYWAVDDVTLTPA